MIARIFLWCVSHYQPCHVPLKYKVSKWVLTQGSHALKCLFLSYQGVHNLSIAQRERSLHNLANHVDSFQFKGTKIQVR
jgi:hypothetical protein